MKYVLKQRGKLLDFFCCCNIHMFLLLLLVRTTHKLHITCMTCITSNPYLDLMIFSLNISGSQEGVNFTPLCITILVSALFVTVGGVFSSIDLKLENLFRPFFFFFCCWQTNNPFNNVASQESVVLSFLLAWPTIALGTNYYASCSYVLLYQVLGCVSMQFNPHNVAH